MSFETEIINYYAKSLGPDVARSILGALDVTVRKETTVEKSPEEMGREHVAHLLKGMKGEEIPGYYYFLPDEYHRTEYETVCKELGVPTHVDSSSTHLTFLHNDGIIHSGELVREAQLTDDGLLLGVMVSSRPLSPHATQYTQSN